MYTLTALLSGPSRDVNDYIEGIKTNMNSGVEPCSKITCQELVAPSQNKYLNQMAANGYVKVDPR